MFAVLVPSAWFVGVLWLEASGVVYSSAKLGTQQEGKCVRGKCLHDQLRNTRSNEVYIGVSREVVRAFYGNEIYFLA